MARRSGGSGSSSSRQGRLTIRASEALLRVRPQPRKQRAPAPPQPPATAPGTGPVAPPTSAQPFQATQSVAATPPPSGSSPPPGAPPTATPGGTPPSSGGGWGRWLPFVGAIVALVICMFVLGNGARLALPNSPLGGWLGGGTATMTPTTAPTVRSGPSPTPQFPPFRGPGPRPTLPVFR
ncbi:MAG: hypothetical protein U0768_16380 [Anaerolineae bacterium]